MTRLANLLNEPMKLHLRQHAGTLILDIYQYKNNVQVGVRSLRFDPQIGYWTEHGQRVHQLSREALRILSQSAPWTMARYS